MHCVCSSSPSSYSNMQRIRYRNVGARSTLAEESENHVVRWSMSYGGVLSEAWWGELEGK